jgi:tetratricopeptide (TPR) repeat protein
MRGVLTLSHPDVLSLEMAIAVSVGKAGDTSQALESLSRVHRDLKLGLGEKHPDTLRAIHAAADIVFDADGSAGADWLLAELHRIRIWAGNWRKCGLIDVASKLGFVLCGENRFREASLLFGPALAEVQGARSEESDVLELLLVGLATSLTGEERYEDAIAVWLRLLEKEDDPETVEFYCGEVARCMSGRGEHREAAAFLRSRDGLNPGFCRYNLACYECLGGNHDEARRLIAAEIAARPAAREQALQDSDLAPLHDFIRALPAGTADQPGAG